MSGDDVSIGIKDGDAMSIGAIFSPKKRRNMYVLGVAWWSYPIHSLFWVLFLLVIAGTVVPAVQSGVAGVSIANIFMWAFQAYVLAFMLKTAWRDGRLAGAKKVSFYFAYSGACIFRTLWISLLLAIGAVLLLGNYDSLSVMPLDGSSDVETAGYWIDDLDFFTSMVFWGVLYVDFSSIGKGNE